MQQSLVLEGPSLLTGISRLQRVLGTPCAHPCDRALTTSPGGLSCPSAAWALESSSFC